MDARTFGFDAPAGGMNDHRRQQRVGMASVAKLRDRASNKYDVHLLDLSITGFRAEAHYSLDAGSIVWLTMPGLQGLEATVAWRRGTVIGCRFRQPLYPAVFDHIVKTLGR
ncbi:MAG: PilZ domain-containing protein [Sphingomonas sp.]|nr:MAG: PilZ domain-containing protein [Sphingomonas sp.]